MNVLLDPRIGGIQTRIAMIAPSLRASGIESLAVIPKGASAGKDLLESVGIETRSMSFGLLIPTLMELSRREKLLWIPESVLFPIYLMREIMGSNIDIVHVNGLLGIRAVIAARVCRKKVVWHLVGTHYSRTAVLLWRTAFRSLAHITIFLSEQTSRFYLGDRKRRSSELIVREPVDVDYFSKERAGDAKLTEIRKDLEINSDERIVLFVGNLNRAKGVEILLEAFAILSNKTKKVKLIISGQTIPTQMGYKDLLDRKLRQLELGGRARFIGRYADLRGLLGIATVLAVPSFAEGTPLVIIEAMSMNIPVVASRVGGTPELVSERRTGLLVPPGDIEALSGAIQFMLDNPEVRESMGKMARVTAIEGFAKDICVQKHADVYEELNRRSAKGT